MGSKARRAGTCCGVQRWWLQPVVSALQAQALFVDALGLAALTDNAALAYLGSLIAGDLSNCLRVAGAVAGGGLTVIAHAPDPAGLVLLKGGLSDGSVGLTACRSAS